MRIVFLLACVCVDVCVWSTTCEQERACECVGMCVHTQDAYLSGARAEGTPAFCHFNPPRYPSDTLEPALSPSFFLTETKGSSQGHWLI